MEMLEFYRSKLSAKILEQDNEVLRKKIVYNNDRLSAVLYEMRKRTIKLLSINKYRSKEFEFTDMKTAKTDMLFLKLWRKTIPQLYVKALCPN